MKVGIVCRRAMITPQFMDHRTALHYRPTAINKRTLLVRLLSWAREELNLRPHAYQACALTT
jgi:hypothetical protein